MASLFSPDWFLALAQVVVVDLLLGGDNAMLIALACRDLPAGMRRRAMLIGVIGALLARLVLASVATMLIGLPSLRLIGGLLLAAIAVNLALPPKSEEDAAPFSASAQAFGIGLVIVVSDLVMSLDNVVALAAITRGDYLMLGLGLLLSIPALMWGAALVGRLIKRHPWTIQAGAALLGWVAGSFAVSDALYAGWISTQSPALIYAVPATVAAYVLLQARLLAKAPRYRKRAVTPRPLKTATPAIRPAPVPQPAPKPAPRPAPPRENAPSSGPEKYALWIFAGLFVAIAVLLTVVIYLGNGEI
jgi:YjbE family integral membrane protein